MASRSIDLISKKQIARAVHFFLISRKANLHVQHSFLSFSCHCFAQLQRCFVGLKRQTSQLHIIFMEELSYVLTQYFVSCVHDRFYFSLPLIFTLLAPSISHCLKAALNFRVRSIGKSGFRFSKSKSGFPNRTRNPKTDFTEKSVLRVDFN